MNSIIAVCDFEAPKWLLFGPNVAPLVYYSHLPIFLISVCLALFILLSNKKNLPNQILFISITSFASWVFLDSIFWASNRGDVIMFVWSVILLLEPLVYISAFYFLYVLLEKKDLSFNKKLLLFILYIPLIIFVPTKYSLSDFDLQSCLSTEGPIALYYTYFVEALITAVIIGFSFHKWLKPGNLNRKEIVYLSSGTVLFLFAFAWGNIIGSFTENWEIGQYGLFGMPIFAGFLAYSIVKFKTLNIKLLGAQALVVSLWVALLAILFVNRIENVRLIVSITLILFLIVGIILIRSVKREVEQREKIEKLAVDLEHANEKLKELDQMKSEFLSLATHQIRSPLTAIRGYASMMLQGDFGKLSMQGEEAADIILKSTVSLINIVGEFLDISRIEQGRMVYNNEKFDIRDLVKEVVAELKPNIDKAKLTIELKVPEEGAYTADADKGKVKQIIGNLIDNAVKYTVKGGIEVSVSDDNGKLKVAVKDTGIGIAPEEMGKLFAKFSRTKDAHKTNVSGTGLGLYVAKKMLEAQGGNIGVTSEGAGKGSTFYIELPRA